MKKTWNLKQHNKNLPLVEAILASRGLNQAQIQDFLYTKNLAEISEL